MNVQFLVDGILVGALIGLGAIGVTLTYSILRFANFAHGEFMAWGAYATLFVAGAIGHLGQCSSRELLRWRLRRFWRSRSMRFYSAGSGPAAAPLPW